MSGPHDMGERGEVLVVYTPQDTAIDLTEMRDYVIDSIAHGVLVIPMNYVIKIQPVAPIVLVNRSDKMETDPIPNDELVFRAHDVVDDNPGKKILTIKDEKRLILARLQKYRSDHGLGCLADVSKTAGAGISDTMLRDLTAGRGSQMGISDWRRINAALDKLEKKG